MLRIRPAAIRNAFRASVSKAPCRALRSSCSCCVRTRTGRRGRARMTADKSDPARYFGQEVRRARLAAKMTLADFGRAAGYNPGQISRIERGKRPPTETFAQMCDK